MSFPVIRDKLAKTLSEKLGHPVEIERGQITKAFNLIKGTDEALKIIKPFINSIAKNIGLKSTKSVVEGPAKRLIRLFSKAVSKYDSKVENVPDVGRLRLLVSSPQDIIELREIFLGNKPSYFSEEKNGDKRMGKILDTHPSNNITLTEFEDFFLIPSKTGRGALHISFSVTIAGKKQIPIELQVLHKDMISAEEFTHDNYKQIQKIERTAELQGRSLTDKEKESIQLYRQSNQKRYLADSLRTGMDVLRRPDIKAQIPKQKVRLKLVA